MSRHRSSPSAPPAARRPLVVPSRPRRPAAALLAGLQGGLAALALLAGPAPPATRAQPGVERLKLELLAEHPHDPLAHTQGLLFHDGRLYESEGKDYAPFGAGQPDYRSSLRQVDPSSGEVLRRVDRSDYWAEGLARVDRRLVQISYLARRATFYDLDSFAELAGVDYEVEEGWGLCHDAPRDRLLMSDGSSRLYLRDPRSFAPLGSLTVTLAGRPLAKLNELECVGDRVYANLFPDIGRPDLYDTIARIDARTGVVDGLIDAGGLLSAAEMAEFGVAELNGIAADPERQVFYLTGKLWPKLFEVRLVPDDSRGTVTPELSPSPEPSASPSSGPSATPTAAPTRPPAPPERLRVQVLERLPHDSTIYTQGLLLHEGILYETSGHPSAATGGPVRLSALRALVPETGEQLRITELDDRYYGEGLALLADRLFWITWQDGLAFEFDRDSFERLEVHSYAGEGWGLCSDGHDLFMSDGSARIIRRDPEDFSVLGQVEVRDMGQPVARLNELECVDDLVYANVWKTDEILRIDRRSGSVLARIDASGLRPASATNREAVLNGIAWDAASQTFLITGKWWDLMYRVRFVPASAAPIHLPLLRQGG